MIVRLAGIVVALVVALGLAANTVSGGKSPDACKASTQAALRACQAEAQSEKWLALGACDNLADRAAVKPCNAQAQADAKDALGTCKEQRDARLAVCGRLGGAPYTPAIDPANFVATIDNPYFPLNPGTTFVYEGQTADGFEHEEFVVTHNTRTILGVACVEVHDTSTLDGALAEDTLDWFAQDKDGNVWYFGENSKEVAGGLVVSLEGSWTAGENGAQPGIVMEAHPAVGDFYRQEFLLNEAEDLAEVTSLDTAATVPAGSFPHCLETAETSPIEPDVLEHKLYALGVGNVLTIDETTGERSELIRITTE